MKKIWKFLSLCIATLGIVTTSFTACGSPNTDNNSSTASGDNAASGGSTDSAETVYFEATVLEVAETALLVEPVENSDELKSADQISVGLSSLESSELDALLSELKAGDIVEIEYDGMIAESYPAQITGLSVRKVSDASDSVNGSSNTPASANTPSSSNTPASVGEPETTRFVRMAMVNDKLFVDTGESSALVKKCGNMDFNFVSSVEQGAPTENYQTNFGTGYGGQYSIRENRIEIYFDEEWHIFACNENSLEGVSMEVTENTNHSLTLEVRNDTDLSVQYGDYYTLEMFDEEISTWIPVPYKDSEIAFDDLAYMPEKNKPVPWSVDWTQMYGELEAGTYRIVKPVDEIHENGELTFYTYMAEFEVVD